MSAQGSGVRLTAGTVSDYRPCPADAPTLLNVAFHVFAVSSHIRPISLLSFDWDGETLQLATRTASPTGRNLAVTQTARLALGHTRDVSMIDGRVEVVEIDALAEQRAERFAQRSAFDPRALATPYRWFCISPRRIQVWRKANELAGRDLMDDGRRLS